MTIEHIQLAIADNEGMFDKSVKPEILKDVNICIGEIVAGDDGMMDLREMMENTPVIITSDAV